MLDTDRVRAALRQARVGSVIHAYDQVETTMAEAFRLAESVAPAGSIVVAEDQTAGRGRFGRTWIAPPGSSLLCSVLLRPTPADLAGLPLIAGLAATDAITETTGLSGRLKWPNDLLVNGRKTGGILVESRLQGTTTVAVIGIGINANFDPAQVDGIPTTATSLACEADHPVDREILLAALLNRLGDWLEIRERGGDVIGPWEQRLETIGKTVDVQTADGPIHGYASGVDSAGRLIVQTADGRTERLVAGEVTLQR